MRPPIDPRLYLVTDRELAGGRDLLDVVLAAVRGGVTLVQLREKAAPTRDFVALARELKARLEVPLIVNDRVDVALAAGADGVHVGQSDMPYADARELMGPDAVIGVSVESLADAEAAEPLDADYLGLSPVHATPTKTDVATQLGLDGVRAIRARSRHRLIGIGGLNADNAGEVIRAGADGIAVVSAIVAAPDPEGAARELRAAIDAALEERP
mgnify:CR=1 FL=1